MYLVDRSLRESLAVLSADSFSAILLGSFRPPVDFSNFQVLEFLVVKRVQCKGEISLLLGDPRKFPENSTNATSG